MKRTGWIESRAGGMMTNKDPNLGGIIDCNAAGLGWFVIFNADIPAIENLESREAALEAHKKAINEMFYL